MSTLASLLPQLREVALDATGTPMAGALLYTYAAGTSTPLATYSDAALTTPNANPVVANAGGLFGPIYLSNAGYKFDLQSSAAVSLYTQDNVYPAAYVATQAVVPVTQTTAVTGTQNNLALTTNVAVLYCTNASLLTITGLSAGIDGQRVRLISEGAGQVDLAHQNAGSTAANRLINVATSGNTSLAAGTGVAEYVYDLATARWRLCFHEQGAPIAWTPSATSITGTNTYTGNYILRGRSCQVRGRIVTSTTINATAGTSFLSGFPFTMAGPPYGVCSWANDSASGALGTNLANTTNFYTPTIASSVAHGMVAFVQIV